MIKIDTVEVATPSSFNVGISDITEGGRNANGKLILELIATKRKLELSYNFITESDLYDLLNAISSPFFEVEYPDPQTSTLTTKTFYVGDRQIETIDYISDVPRWKNVSFNFIEQ